METELKKLVINEFSGENAQTIYIEKAEEGLWKSEENLINKYFKKKSKVLDIGCGTGRTTIDFVKKDYNVIGIDFVPKMIENAKKIAKKKKMRIDYCISDATNLNFKNNSFDYALFSNQGWTQIPGKENRLTALKEIRRVLKKDGVYIFSVHLRRYNLRWLPFWSWMWFKLNILKLLGLKIEELDFGDRFFKRDKKTKSKQYLHICSIKEVTAQLEEAGFKIPYTGVGLSEHSGSSPTFFVCKK